ncbi:hypothetical protein [Pantoea ananatis]|uniref:hypothetical protein n=1 Tax=Pantoea ananas TaxID=553 RepID=UPI0004953E76|nr:hypothetical protein [Pantoea ananatis]NQE77638.1 hypothetical protein [Pantoea ananatis]NQE82182.1 hypothetical protein [Pantoea ananatis]PQK93895.1 hypothetical protein CG434_23060 [Pantoea ananatis]
MYIRLDLFADMLRIRPGDLLQAVRTDGMLAGLHLPQRRQVRGAAVMFLQEEAIAFAKQWQTRSTAPPAPDADEPLVSLDAFARQAGIAPLALWLAASAGKPLRGIVLPVAVKAYGSQLMFSAKEAGLFAEAYKQRLAKT